MSMRFIIPGGDDVGYLMPFLQFKWQEQEVTDCERKVCQSLMIPDFYLIPQTGGAERNCAVEHE